MKKIFVFIVLFSFAGLFAQETAEDVQPVQPVQPEEAEMVKEPESAENPKPIEEIKKETVTMTKEEVEALVKKMVAEELAKKETQKKSKEVIVTEGEKDEPTEKGDKLERDGLIAPSYSKSSLTFIMGDDNLRDNSQYSPKWDIGQRYEYEDFAQRVYGYSNTARSSTRLSLFHEEEGFIKNMTARISLSFGMYNSMNSINNKIETYLREDKSFEIGRASCRERV